MLDAECGTDHTLRAEVQRLLQGDGTGDDAFSRFEAHTRIVPTDPLLGRRLGAYRLTARLATGGMGVVYRGERADGLYQQEVAIKLIRAECASEWMLRRFEFERRTLATLQHPGIARLHDGGTTDDGCPYFVMELVRGEPIDRYCDRECLPIAARLRLFLQVCRAVQFAHRSLVVHCDLKPANILIDERGLPRLLDFGIARLLEAGPEPASTAAAPRTVARVLTPEYASPEQLAGGPATTAHDIYSLGVILYELATGCRPFVQVTRSPAEWERLVREQEPARPSTRLGHTSSPAETAAIAARCGTTPAGLRRALRGDLDRIVLMALRKEPERRYASVQEFAEDLQRHLEDRPVRARADSVPYRLVKFTRRNRAAVAAAVIVLAALLTGFFSARRSERIARAEAQHATMEADSFQAIASFLMDAFLPAQPGGDPAWQERARTQILDQAQRVHRQYANADHVRANLLDTLGQVCLRLALFEDAERLMREALAIRGETFGHRSLEYSLSLRSLGQLKYRTGEYAEAAQLMALALPIHRAAPTDTHASVAALANDLAACLRSLGREAESLALHHEALAIRRGEDNGSLPVAESLNNLAGVHLGRGEHQPAVAALREALAIRISILGDVHPLTLQTTSNLAGALWRHGERTEARDLTQRAASGYEGLGRDGEEGLGLLLGNLATMQLQENDLDGAAASLVRALALQAARLGDDHPVVAVTLTKLASLEHRQGHDETSRPRWERALRILRAPPAPPRELAQALHGYGACRLDGGAYDEAAQVFAEAVALHQSQQLDNPTELGRVEFLWARCLVGMQQPAAAREHARTAARLLDGSPDATAAERTQVHELLEEAERRAGG